MRKVTDFVGQLYSKARANARGCWIWTGTTSNGRYGAIWVANIRGRRGSMIGAHRRSWELTYGPVPPGLEVCHGCDDGLCINPQHLFLGTHAVNMADMKAKGRGASRHWVGSEAPPAKLVEAQVLEIRRRVAEGERRSHLAREFGVSASNITWIIDRKSWTHI